MQKSHKAAIEEMEKKWAATVAEIQVRWQSIVNNMQVKQQTILAELQAKNRSDIKALEKRYTAFNTEQDEIHAKDLKKVNDEMSARCAQFRIDLDTKDSSHEASFRTQNDKY